MPYGTNYSSDGNSQKKFTTLPSQAVKAVALMHEARPAILLPAA